MYGEVRYVIKVVEEHLLTCFKLSIVDTCFSASEIMAWASFCETLGTKEKQFWRRTTEYQSHFHQSTFKRPCSEKERLGISHSRDSISVEEIGTNILLVICYEQSRFVRNQNFILNLGK